MLRKMKENNILLLVNNKDIVKKLKEKSNITFLFPLEEFSIGFVNTFKVEDISDGYIFVNRILDNEGIEKFKVLLDNLPKSIKGIVFDDIGILHILNNKKMAIKKILFLNHFNCNYESINCYLEYVDSVVISCDVTFREIKEILKELVVYIFGYVNIMYSRRSLISNYNKHFLEDAKLDNYIEEVNSKKKFKILENEYGTVIYTDKPFNGLEVSNLDNVLFDFINGVFLSDEEILEIINRQDNLKDKYPYTYLGENDTIYKIKEEG